MVGDSPLYWEIISGSVHKVKQYGTNHIERKTPKLMPPSKAP